MNGGAFSEETLKEFMAIASKEENWEYVEGIMFTQLLEPYRDLPEIDALMKHLEEKDAPL